MKKIKLTKSKDSLQLINDWYDRFESALPYPTTTKRVETSFGYTDVMISPGDEREPIVVLHGAMAGAPHAIGELCDFPARRRVYAVNVPGQSPRSAEVRLDFKSDEYGQWLDQVLDQLSIDKAIVCGVSWGGCVALQLAKHFPNRIGGLVLVVPGSIVKGPVLASLWHVALPLMRFKFFPSEKNRERALRRIFTSQDHLWSPYLGDALQSWNVDFSIPPLMSPEELERLNAPVYVIAADRDLYFPGEKLIKRSHELFNNFVGSHLLKDSFHSPSFRPEDRMRFTTVFEHAVDRVCRPEAVVQNEAKQAN